MRVVGLGALAFLIHERKGAMHFRIAGRDQSFNEPSPGLLLHARSIRMSIARGIKTYDFLRGNEPYKYSFGARDRKVRSLVITRRSRIM